MIVIHKAGFVGLSVVGRTMANGRRGRCVSRLLNEKTATSEHKSYCGAPPEKLTRFGAGGFGYVSRVVRYSVM